MSESYAESDQMTKAHVVAQNINRLIDIVGLKCAKGNDIRHYFDIGAMTDSDEANVVFKKDSSSPSFIPIQDLYRNPTNLAQLGSGKEDELVWIEPVAEG